MKIPLCTEMAVWKTLKENVPVIHQPENHLKYLTMDRHRNDAMVVTGAGLKMDFSRQRLTMAMFNHLIELAMECRVISRFNAMMKGDRINVTENRAALHTACRNFSDDPVYVDDVDVMPEIRKVRHQIDAFSRQVLAGEIRGTTGKRLRDIVVIGIGGSYHGIEFVSEALYEYRQPGMRIQYLANVDIYNFGRVVSRIDPQRTLWVVISKSYTTPEVAANELLARRFMQQQGLDPKDHFVTVTAKGSPGDDPTRETRAVFHMFDFIGGRYSVSSAVGGVPLSLYLGYENFQRFLKGAQQMDHHAATAFPEKNLPLIAALIAVWNNNFLGYPVQAIIPYTSALAKLVPHVQQLYMESTGKSVTATGAHLNIPTGMIIFGEPGTNAQHSFFQMAHQGRPFPIEFIGVVKPFYDDSNRSRGVTNHQELWANLVAQMKSLATGFESDDPARMFPGNRPSSLIILEDLSPESVGRLLAFYEAKTVFESFIWNINPFDQFGVELGKTIASDIRNTMADANKNGYEGDGATQALAHLNPTV